MTRLLMTLDAAGGVWRYAMDLARGLRAEGVETAFLGFGPRPRAEAEAEAQEIGPLDWSDLPLDWMAERPPALEAVPDAIAVAARRARADIVQVNVPSQAAGLPEDLPVVAVHHSCVATWFRAVRGAALPAEWAWKGALTQTGLDRAEAVVAPSVAHGRAVSAVYGARRLRVVPNGTDAEETEHPDGAYAAAAGRWWDEGKDGATLDAAAAKALWPVVMMGALHAPGGTGWMPRHAVATGALPHAAAAALVRNAGVFVAPSRYEPFGLAVAEAARAARALVLSDIPVFRELWGHSAIYVSPGDAEALAAAINTLAADPDLRRTLGRKAQARARRFTVAAQARTMAQVYGHVLARRAMEEAR
jgi:glycosyltransferase involved in cell wall biosynthesis